MIEKYLYLDYLNIDFEDDLCITPKFLVYNDNKRIGKRIFLSKDSILFFSINKKECCGQYECISLFNKLFVIKIENNELKDVLLASNKTRTLEKSSFLFNYKVGFDTLSSSLISFERHFKDRYASENKDYYYKIRDSIYFEKKIFTQPQDFEKK